MSDLALYRRSDGNFDLAFDEDKGDLLTTDSLENAVIMSIGSYARERKLGRAANLKPCVGGWWGDAIDDKGTLGGYLYEAFPGKLNDDTARLVEKLVDESLEWMVDDSAVKSVSSSAAVDGESVAVTVVIATNSGDDERFDYSFKWGVTDGI